MSRIVSLLAAFLFASCLVKYSYNPTGPEYPSRGPLSPVEVFMDGEPPYPVESIGTLAFTDPLPRKIQIEEAKRMARKRGGNVIVRIKNDSTEGQGGYTFRVARVENLDRLIQARRGGERQYGHGIAPVGSYGSFHFGDDTDGGEGPRGGEPAPFTYYPE